MSDNRTRRFRRNEALESLLFSLNTDLQPSEQSLLNQYKNKPMEYPLVLIMGPLRSGTTLFTQWLANTGLVSYPTNLLSRFYKAPIIGAKVQLMLTDPRFNFRNELGEFSVQPEYESENGKTKGALSPNEFWFFWRRFLSEPGRDVWKDEELRQSMDVKTMKAELNGMMDIFQKPFAAKGMLFNYNIPFLDSVFEKVLFVQIKRDPVANVASILEARKRQLGNEHDWYSFKIPEYEKLKEMDSVSQACGQFYYINKSVDKGIAIVDESRKIVVKYEDFCANPEMLFNELVHKLSINNSKYMGPVSFDISRTRIKNAKIISNSLLRFN